MARITKSVAEKILRLLRTKKHSHREVAYIVGVSRGVVGNIARGKRYDFIKRVRKYDKYAPLLSTGPRLRCPTCGVMVFMPCRECEIKKIMADRDPQPRFDRHLETDLAPDLEPDEQRRLEKIRAAKTAAAAERGPGNKSVSPRAFTVRGLEDLLDDLDNDPLD